MRVGRRSRRAKTPQTRNVSEEDGIDGFEDEIDADDADSDELQRRGNELLDEICELTAESDGHATSDIFMDLPVKKHYPDYYQVIQHPVSIKQLRKKLKQDKIELYETLVEELRIMCQNAKTYNEEGSWVYTDAEQIEAFLDGK